jgi:hypothetical protein
VMAQFSLVSVTPRALEQQLIERRNLALFVVKPIGADAVPTHGLERFSRADSTAT